MVEVFKTNVHERKGASQVIEVLLKEFPTFEINFDLEDVDRILRVKGPNVCANEVMLMVKNMGYVASMLDDEPID